MNPSSKFFMSALLALAVFTAGWGAVAIAQSDEGMSKQMEIETNN